MITDVMVVDVEAIVASVKLRMIRQGIRGLPVVDRGKNIRGIVTQNCIINVIAEYL